MYDYFNGKCGITGEDMTIGLEKVDVTTMGEKDRVYMYGNIKCEHSYENCLNCQDCPIIMENGIDRNERFK